MQGMLQLFQLSLRAAPRSDGTAIHRRSQGGGQGARAPPIEIPPMI